MQKVLIYCETWCVQFRFLSLTIPKSYNSMMLESCSYFFAHRLSFCCQCKHSPRAGLEASRTPIMIADIQMAGLTIPSSPVHTHEMVKLIGTRIYTVLMSVFATQLRSKEATVRWKDRDRSEILWNILCTCIENASLLSVLVTPLEALTKYLTTIP